MTNHEKVHYYFSQYESPEHFITWGYLFSIAACLGRKVWFQEGEPFFANEQIIIVGPAGVGKSLPSRKLCGIVKSLHKTNSHNIPVPLVNVAPTCTTLEKLYEVLERCGNACKIKEKPYFHSSLSFILEEMGLLFKSSDRSGDLTLFLNAGYDCIDKFEYSTKTKGENRLTNLCVNFLGCCTPEWVADNIKSNVIGNGWSSRVIWLYGAEERQLTTFFKFTEDQNQVLEDLKKHFREVAELKGEVLMTPECLDYYDKWYQKNPKKNRLNNDSKLDGYYARKRAHAIKVAMLVHFSEKTTMQIDLEDLVKALKLLAAAEIDMHKALASINSNPTARMATDIERLIKDNRERGLSKADIIGSFFNRDPRGLVAIDEAMEYLRITDQIKCGEVGRYYSVEKIVPVRFVEVKRDLEGLKEDLLKEARYDK